MMREDPLQTNKAYSIECPYCHRGAGQLCVSSSGRDSTYPHTMRTIAVESEEYMALFHGGDPEPVEQIRIEGNPYTPSEEEAYDQYLADQRAMQHPFEVIGETVVEVPVEEPMSDPDERVTGWSKLKQKLFGRREI